MQQNASSHRSLRRYTHNCEKKEVASANKWYKIQYQGKEKEERKRKDGKTTSESGSVSSSTAVREQPKTSEMAEDCRRCEQLCPYDPDGSGTQVTGNYRIVHRSDNVFICGSHHGHVTRCPKQDISKQCALRLSDVTWTAKHNVMFCIVLRSYILMSSCVSLWWADKIPTTCDGDCDVIRDNYIFACA